MTALELLANGRYAMARLLYSERAAHARGATGAVNDRCAAQQMEPDGSDARTIDFEPRSEKGIAL